MFKQILIANRGEIACRIIKTARRMGIATVAVYSDADRDALHVEMADEAVAIGPATGGAKLPGHRQDRRRLQREPAPRRCIPGYGFLSERAAFAEALAAAGIVFIGPNPGGHRGDGRQDRVEEGRRRAPRSRPFPAISA